MAPMTATPEQVVPSPSSVEELALEQLEFVGGGIGGSNDGATQS